MISANLFGHQLESKIAIGIARRMKPSAVMGLCKTANAVANTHFSISVSCYTGHYRYQYYE